MKRPDRMLRALEEKQTCDCVLAILPLAALLLLLGGAGLAFGYAEDSSEGAASHSTVHYELTRTLARGAGFSAGEAELIAVFDQAVDSGAYQGDSADSPFVELTGTARRDDVEVGFFHYPRRGPADGAGEEHPGGRDTCSFFGAGDDPCGNFPEVQALERWAVDGGRLRARGLAPPTAAVDDAPAETVAAGNLEALGIYLHALADSYSHEACMSQGIRTHRREPEVCGFVWHQDEEFGPEGEAEGVGFTRESGRAVWQALQRYHAVDGGGPAPWGDAEALAFIDDFAALSDSSARRTLALEALAGLE
ncbi:MAG: hypothetical protein QNJ30_07790 [Kiloniellales bacterium]|nr:hypothetical protein [Kiloniellales bacterium]